MKIKIKNYLSLVKFSHTIFAMPFALIGFFLGLRSLARIPYVLIQHNYIETTWQKVSFYLINDWYIFILVLLCMIFARSSAMAFNRYLDRKFDAKNPRTAIREIPKGIITEKNALIFVIFNCVAFVICTFFINTICFFLSPVALFVVLFYSYTNRFTSLCHLVLVYGLILAPSVPCLALKGRL